MASPAASPTKSPEVRGPAAAGPQACGERLARRRGGAHGASRPQILSTGLWVMWGFRGTPCGRGCGQPERPRSTPEGSCPGGDAGTTNVATGLTDDHRTPRCRRCRARGRDTGRPENERASRAAVRAADDDAGARAGPEGHPRPAGRGETGGGPAHDCVRDGSVPGGPAGVVTSHGAPGPRHVGQGIAVLAEAPGRPGGLGRLQTEAGSRGRSRSGPGAGQGRAPADVETLPTPASRLASWF